MFEAVEDAMPTVTVQLEPDRLAERFRLKRMSVRWTRPDGEVTDCRVSAVSMPDELGRCEMTLVRA